MILVSVGTQLPFDRLVRCVDDWAKGAGRTDVVAQTGPSRYEPCALKVFQFLGPDEFRKLFAEAEIVIAHAGMGSILSALECSKPIIIMPRRHTLGEHRNEHQLGTANRFRGMPGIYVVDDEVELQDHLNRLPELAAAVDAAHKASEELLCRLRAFINEDEGARGRLARVLHNLASVGSRISTPPVRGNTRERVLRKTWKSP